VPGEESRLGAVVTNAGIAEIQIKHVKFRGFGTETKLDAADKMLPGTETSAELEIVDDQKLRRLTVPSRNISTMAVSSANHFDVDAELTIEGVTFT
jgi:hypothetical protein